MGHSTKGAVTGDFDGDEEEVIVEEESSFEEEVNAAAKAMTQDDKGNWVLPEGLSSEVKYAATLEKRRRDTQSAAAKTNQELEVTKDLNSKLQLKLKEAFKPTLSEEQEEELEDLASSDPEAYRQKKNEYENSAASKFEDELSSLGFDTEQVNELSTRAELLTEFLEENPGLVLDDEVFENDLPPRITGKLQRGEITFQEFLVESKDFLTKGVTTKSKEEEEEPALEKTGGSSVSEADIKSDITLSYANEVY